MRQWGRGLLVLLALVLLAATALATATRQVVVQKAPVRQAPQVFGKIVATLGYGATVEVLEEQPGWYRVRLAGGGSGWLHASAVAKHAAPLRAGQSQAALAASQQEVTLAGKGFNSQVEKAYQQQHGEADFAWIDRMEKMTIDEAQLRQFLQSGQLAGGGHGN